MSLLMSPFTIHRQQPLTTESWQADEFPFGGPYGAPANPAQVPDGQINRPYEPGETFEQSYPRYPFSELVRLGVAFSRMIAKLRRRTPLN